MPQIHLNHVSRTYSSARGPAVVALRDVSLEIEQGEFVAIVGPSGGGKTTLMNILGLLDEPTSGEYLLDGQAVNVGGPRNAPQLRARIIGFIFQAFHLLPARPAVDSVELGLLYRGVPRARRRARAQEALLSVGLAERAADSTSQLSGGQRQRVAIARAIAGDAKLILADEPTGNLDSENAERVLDELQRLNVKGSTVIVVTHSSEVASRAQRIVRLADGAVVSDQWRGRPLTSDALSPSVGLGRSAKESLNAGEPQVASNTLLLPTSTYSRLRVLDLLRDAWASVLSRRNQTIGLSFAVAIAVALTITTLGLSSSATAQVSATFDAHLNREVTARWSTGTAHSPTLTSVPEVVGDLRGVEAAAVLLDLSPSTVSSFAESRQVQPHVAVGNITAAGRLEVAEAPWHSGELHADEVLIGDLLASQLQLSSLAGAPSIYIDGNNYVVAGLITGSPRLPLLRGEVVMGAPADINTHAATDASLLAITAPGAAPQVARQMPAAINPYQPDAIFVAAPSDSAILRGQVEEGLRTALTAFTVLALIVAVAALMNATLLAVHTRRGEIGMRKALGARNAQIGALITIESAYVGLLGGAIGLLLGMGAILVVTISQKWSPVFDTALTPVAMLVGLVVGASGGGLAAIQAARLKPADNLRN
ncbi:ATP-binding cassette domain-containing protein [Microbacterium sp. 20-116]|uniref:ABC transporter ATP-binding protein/permease n=1 Tax=unclassified Microbacterium TaxID=2609290 RepID=UPI002270EE68|nr:ATP-binding cassette domain-containing protein [Microbacterium sp. SL75]WAC69401.1 ATP-binding cassette domain-containing protein [Microbacterium sp. SL75]